MLTENGRPEGASGRGRLAASRPMRLLAVAAMVVVAGLAVGAASRPHSVDLSLSAPQPGEAAVMVVLVLAGAMGLLLGANRYPMWVGDPRAAVATSPPKSRLPWAVRIVLVLLPLAVVAFALASMKRFASSEPSPRGFVPTAIPANVADTSGNGAALVLACVVVALTAGLVAAVLLRKMPALPIQVATPADAAAEILDEGLDAILAEDDPRKAVIAAYVAMERAMARRGWARRPHEAPTEYLTRVLGVAPSRAGDLGELVRLFELARFSKHTVTASMRETAVDVVGRLRADLQEPV